MSPITTRIRSGTIKTRCLSYRNDAENFIRVNGSKWPTDNGIDFRMPVSLQAGTIAEVGFTRGSSEYFKRFRLTEIQKQRLIWDPLKKSIRQPCVQPVDKIETWSETLKSRAQELRKRNPDSEAWFNSIAKELGIFGYQWNYPIADKYIVDFIWVRERIILEMDGNSHTEDRAAYDRKRQKFLESLGYVVLRIDYPPVPIWKNTIQSLLKNLFAEKLKMLEGL